MTEKELAQKIYQAWMKDERWARLDLAAASNHVPLGYFWAEIAAKIAHGRQERNHGCMK